MPQPCRFTPLARDPSLLRALNDAWHMLEDDIVAQTIAFCGTRMARMVYRDGEVPTLEALCRAEIDYTRSKFLGPFDVALDTQMLIRGENSRPTAGWSTPISMASSKTINIGMPSSPSGYPTIPSAAARSRPRST